MLSRRDFFRSGAKWTGLLATWPFTRAVAQEDRTLLKNGLIVDGSGGKSHTGDVLVEGGVIIDVSDTSIDAPAAVMDCTDKVIAPGFIDAHSHMDWLLPLEGRDELKSPFIAQGCTTFVTGNCGYGVAGFRKGSEYKNKLIPGLFVDAGLPWDTMAEYYAHVNRVGLSHNMFNMAGHGTVRGSIQGNDPSALAADEMKELLALLEQAMEEGAAGVSFGLQYAPGLFAPLDEIKAVARLVKSKDKIVTVHGRAYSWLSTEYPPDLFGPPHNLLALKEMLQVARETGVRLQYSHLMFAGAKSHPTWKVCLEAIDAAIAEGIDVYTDSYPYHCGNSVMSVVIPTWFRADFQENLRNPEALKRLELELRALATLVGLTYSDIQITAANHPDLVQYEGKFLSEIAEDRKETPFETFIEIAKMTAGHEPRVLLHKYSNMEIIDALMRHPACLFMTDATAGAESGNPAAYGTFPLFLQYARQRKTLTLEQVVRKMTGATADRFRIKNRGYIRKGMAADITIFDWNTVRDNTTVREFDNPPTGIEAVFINGKLVARQNTVDETIKAGQVLST